MKTSCTEVVLAFCFLFVLPETSKVWTASVPAVTSNGHTKNIDLLMPNVQPTVMDTYLCYSMKADSTFYITGFQPKAKMETAHHILLYGCTVPGKNNEVWDCGEMHTSNQEFEQGPVCKDGSSIIYAWAMDAPELQLPQGVGFKVGPDTSINWIVLQVHYKSVSSFLPPMNATDHSGVTLVTTDIRQPKRAGVYLLGTNGEIPPHSVTYMETACSFNQPIVLHPFAFRTHAHTHGQVISGYRIRNKVWTEVGRKSPQLPQMFYNVTNPGMTVEPGDVLAARCTMANDDNITIPIGPTSKDEMCNFYMMYYVDGDQIAEDNYCFSPGPPTWTWYLFDGLHPENAPLNASIIPGTTELIKSTQKFLHHMEKSMELQREKIENNLKKIFGSLRGYDPDTANYVFPNEPDLDNDPLESYLNAAVGENYYQPVIDSNEDIQY